MDSLAQICDTVIVQVGTGMKCGQCGQFGVGIQGRGGGGGGGVFNKQ